MPRPVSSPPADAPDSLSSQLNGIPHPVVAHPVPVTALVLVLEVPVPVLDVPVPVLVLDVFVPDVLDALVPDVSVLDVGMPVVTEEVGATGSVAVFTPPVPDADEGEADDAVPPVVAADAMPSRALDWQPDTSTTHPMICNIRTPWVYLSGSGAPMVCRAGGPMCKRQGMQEPRYR